MNSKEEFYPANEKADTIIESIVKDLGI